MDSPDSYESPQGLTAKGRPRHFVKHSYTDRASEPDGPLSKKDEHILNLYDKENVGAGPFPVKLHIVLKIMENEGKDHIVSWLPHGRAFAIHNPKSFESEVMKKYFNQSQISSFRRQLNLYGFIRLSKGRDSGAYYHELFLRGKPLLSMKMMRERIKGTKIRASSSPAEEPEFYRMPFLGPVNRHVVSPPTNTHASHMVPPTAMHSYVLGMGGDPVSAAGPYLNARPMSIPSVSTDMSSPHTAAAAVGNFGPMNSSLPPTYLHHINPQMINTTFVVHENIPSDIIGYTNAGPYHIAGHNPPRVLYHHQPIAATGMMDRNGSNSFILNGPHLIHPGSNFVPSNIVSHQAHYGLNLAQPTNSFGDGNAMLSAHNSKSPYIMKQHNGAVPSSSMAMVHGHRPSLGSNSSSASYPTRGATVPNISSNHATSSSSNGVHPHQYQGTTSAVTTAPAHRKNKMSGDKQKQDSINAASTMLSLGDEADASKSLAATNISVPTKTLEI